MRRDGDRHWSVLFFPWTRRSSTEPAFLEWHKAKSSSYVSRENNGARVQTKQSKLACSGAPTPSPPAPAAARQSNNVLIPQSTLSSTLFLTHFAFGGGLFDSNAEPSRGMQIVRTGIIHRASCFPIILFAIIRRGYYVVLRVYFIVMPSFHSQQITTALSLVSAFEVITNKMCNILRIHISRAFERMPYTNASS